jgi:hypothetical protein
MTFGRGDAILRFPELIEGYEDDAESCRIMSTLRSIEQGYVAVHLDASTPNKIPSKPDLLARMLDDAEVPFLLVGDETTDLPFNFRLHADIVRHARKFVGTLSVFNCVAQLAKVPSYVLVNRSLQAPDIYHKMRVNGAWIVPWNVGALVIEEIYADVVKWAKQS